MPLACYDKQLTKNKNNLQKKILNCFAEEQQGMLKERAHSTQ